MAKVKLGFANKKFLYLYSTGVENMFINEFMPAAPGDYVKVYIYGLMMVRNDMEFEMKELSHMLGMSMDDVNQAWEYWARNGLVKLLTDDIDGKEIVGISYVSLPEYFYGRRLNSKPEESASRDEIDTVEEVEDVKLNLPEESDDDYEYGYVAEDDETDETSYEISDETEYKSYSDENQERINRMVNMVIKGIFDQYEDACGRTISKREIKMIEEAIKVYNVSPDVFSYAIKYCEELEKTNIDYIYKVAMRWTEEGCRDISQVKEHLDMYSKKNANYAAVFREMGFTRLPNPSDKAMMDRWFEEMGYSLADVLNACRASAGLREPTLRYVNAVLENMQLEAGGIDTRPKPGAVTRAQHVETGVKVSSKVLDEYYEYLRNESERIQNAHIDELCARHEDIRGLFEVENKLNEELLGGALIGSKERRDAVRLQRRELESDKKELLIHYGYPADYLDRKYKCRECNDTGITDEGRNCICRKERADEAYKWYQTIKKN